MESLASIIVGIWFLPVVLFIVLPLSVAALHLISKTTIKLMELGGNKKVESRQTQGALS